MQTPSKTPLLQTTLDPETASTFFTFLAYGVLTAIQKEVVSPETGIWTLGRPALWKALLHHPHIPPSVLEILQEADEWAALKFLNSDAYQATLTRHLQTLESELQKTEAPAWWNQVKRI
jgi:hypothetical protein